MESRLHSMNAYAPILCTPDGITNDLRFLHFSNVPSPILVILEDNETFESEPQLENANVFINNITKVLSMNNDTFDVNIVDATNYYDKFEYKIN